MSKNNDNKHRRREKITLGAILSAEVLLIILIMSFSSIPLLKDVYAVVGTNNVTVTTLLQVGNVYPEIINISVNGNSNIDLSPNATVSVLVNILARDYNGEADIINATVVFFSVSNSSYGASDDKNNHYSNNTCDINTTYGDIYEVNITCGLNIAYFAYPGIWNATAIVYDNASLTANENRTTTVNTLLALGLPDSINYGIVNATAVSEQQAINVTNFGNVGMNLSLRGYAITPNDNLSMNCTLGTIKNISINYEKYNLTASTSGAMTFTSFEANYTNLTSTSTIKRFDLNARQNDTAYYIDDTNATYWRMYVPLGVAGSCSGNIVFGAVQSSGS